MASYYNRWKNRPQISTNKGAISGIGLNVPTNIDINKCHDPNIECVIDGVRKNMKFKARPFKHYRRQYTNISNSRTMSASQFDLPGGYIAKLNTVDCSNNGIQTNIAEVNLTGYDNTSGVVCPCKYNERNALNLVRNTRHDIKSNTQYNNSTAEYLRSKCKSFKQNEGYGAPQTNPNERKMTDCTAYNCNTTYRPIGATCSSDRITRLKHEANARTSNFKSITSVVNTCSDKSLCYRKKSV